MFSRSPQMNLFDQPEPHFGNCGQEIRSILSASIKRSGLSREQIADKMSEAMGKKITRAQLDAFTAEAKTDHRFPLEYIPAFIAATKDPTILQVICKMCGGSYISEKENMLLEMSRISEEEKKLRNRRRAISTLLELDR